MLQSFLTGILSGIVIGCLGAGMVMVLIGRQVFRIFRPLLPQIERFNHLRDAGERITAKVVNIQETPSASTRPSYTLFAQWQDPNTDQIYTLSAGLRDPTRFTVGDPIDFFIDPADPGNHFAQFLFESKTIEE